MIPRPLARAYGNAVVLVNLRGQRRLPYLPVPRLHALREKRLRRLVRFAAATVPYYRRLFGAGGIDPRDIRSARDLDRLPLIDKAAVAKDPGRFRSTSHAGQTAIPFPTSGTTGQRLDIHHDRYSLLANIAFGERERDVLTRVCGQRFGYREVYIEHQDSTTRKVWDIYAEWTFIPVRPRRLHLSVLEPVDGLAESISAFRPDVLFGYGSYLEMFFKTLAARRLRMSLPKAVVYDSDAMSPEGRAFIEGEFGIPVLSWYNAMESFKIGFTCEKRLGFHVHEDICDVKIVDGAGRRLPDGERGEVVISNLLNRGTVLLNYRLGDIAVFESARCGCGRSLRTLSALEGRVADILVFPDGRFVHPLAVWRVFKGRSEVLRYQLIQREWHRFDLRLATTDRAAYERLVPGILADLRPVLGEHVQVAPEFHATLDAGPSGKFKPVVALLASSAHQTGP